MSDDQDQHDEDDYAPFDHGGCHMPHVHNGEYYDCDGHPI